MKNIRLEVFEQTTDNYQLRFFIDNTPTPYQTRAVSAQDLQQFISNAKQHYEDGLQLQNLGKDLFNWLNGQESTLQNFQQETILQIPNTHGLHHLAWELLHTEQYLCMNLHKPFTPLRLIGKEKQNIEPAKRQLRVLFMASSPEDVKPVLAFEKEEGLILKATQKLPLELVVEESGSLAGLQEWLNYDDESMRFDDESMRFDVVHLTGHASFNQGKPVFVLEDDLGKVQLAEADEIAEVFSYKGHFPRLLFLSGCETAQSHDNALPSLCEALVQAGVPAVLGWAKPVYDFIGLFTAQKLYAYLADGLDLARAVAKTRRDLYVYEMEIQQRTPHYKPQWHLLRFYSDYTPLNALVLKGRAQAKREIRQEFLDKNAKTEVCPRELFVGRRRLLQTALRILRSQQGDANYADGLMLLGMGGLGKSSLALRICQRLAVLLPKRFVWMGKIDEIALRGVFSEELPEHASLINEILNQSLALDLRLKQLFNQFPVLHSALFVFDDFEQNFIKNNHQQLEAGASQIITALLKAIRETGSPSRVLITCRYAFSVQKPLQLAELALNSFEGTELQKKLQALRESYLTAQDTPAVSKALEQQAIDLGAGNPRLLEWLYKVLADKNIDKTALFTQLEAKQAEFREKLLLQTLLNYQSAEVRNLLARIALFNLPVPIDIFAQAFSQPELIMVLRPALVLGLVEHYQETLFVSRLLVPFLAQECEHLEQPAIYANVAQGLYAKWWESDYPINFEEHIELARIAQLGAEKTIFSKVGGSLSTKLFDIARYDEAKTLFDELLPIRQEIGDKRGEGTTLNNISQIFRARGDYETALRYLQQSLAIRQEIGDKRGEGTTLNNISQIYDARGDTETALRYLQQSLAIQQEIGDKSGEGTTLNNMATTAYARGDYETALRYLQQSLAIQQEIGDKSGEGTTLNNISQIYDARGDTETALRYLQQSLAIRQEIGDKSGEGTTLNNIGQIFKARGDYETALRYLQQSLAIQQEIGDKSGEGTTLNNISQIYDARGDNETALRYLQQSLAILQEIGDKRGEGSTLNNMATTAYARGDYETALRYLQQSLAIRQEIGDVAGLCATLFNMGHIHLQNKEMQEGIAKFVEVYRIAHKIGEAQALQALEELAKDLGEDGLNYWARLLSQELSRS
ncbi:tetratricopeptide repeat protein [Beggiatoa leptomitoformis]|nr:tetratricopeptide repeat protein [Beggiatoa leptomitoformis]